jgi:hypothetical protein
MNPRNLRPSLRGATEATWLANASVVLIRFYYCRETACIYDARVDAFLAVLAMSALTLFLFILIFVPCHGSKFKHNKSKVDEDLSKYIRTVMENIDNGIPRSHTLHGNVKFEVALKKNSQAEGAFRVEVVEIGGKYSREELSKVTFEIGRARHSQTKLKAKRSKSP